MLLCILPQTWRWKIIALSALFHCTLSLPGKRLGLALPGEGKGNSELLLIYRRYTDFDCLGIWFAKLAEYKVIGTCTPRSYEPVRSRGAD
jgi:hypothetical protein